MARHVTITDKERPAALIENGAWQFVWIRDRDGMLKYSVRPDESGIYLLQVQLRFEIVKEPDSIIEARYDRYPWDPDDNGTAYQRIDPRRSVDEGEVSTTMHGKIEINPPGATYSSSTGLGIRLRGGVVRLINRTFKFIQYEPEDE